MADALHDPRVDALETAAILVAAVEPDDVLQGLCDHSCWTVGAEWAAVVDVDPGIVHAEVGPAPSPGWLTAFVGGSRAAALESGLDDVLWAPLPGAELALVMGRRQSPFRAREHRQAAALARLADTRYCELSQMRSRRSHPAAHAPVGRLATQRR